MTPFEEVVIWKTDLQDKYVSKLPYPRVPHNSVPSEVARTVGLEPTSPGFGDQYHNLLDHVRI